MAPNMLVSPAQVLIDMTVKRASLLAFSINTNIYTFQQKKIVVPFRCSISHACWRNHAGHKLVLYTVGTPTGIFCRRSIRIAHSIRLVQQRDRVLLRRFATGDLQAWLFSLATRRNLPQLVAMLLRGSPCQTQQQMAANSCDK